ncbi:RNA polymerase sigma factor [Candidatus Acetothermia bacterium]|nr:RNA polymerase sigma factor [Candidatus Acetothermia bacterium]MBI3643362.1 RNA polymerase sigma factor [Candidatus Acetothermia bacterium]
MELGNEIEIREEELLLSRVALKDQKAFEELYRRYSPRLFRYAQVRLRDSHAAEEVTQEALWAIWQGAHRYQGTSKPSTWIFGIAHHKVADLLKKRIKENLTQDELSKRSKHESDVNHAKNDVLHAALAKVSEPCRDALVLSFFYKFNYKEIGEILGCNEGTVKNRIFRGKEQLRELL